VDCVLLRINSATGATSCVDSSLVSLDWGYRGSGNIPTPPVQFDRNGSIYYVGQNQAGNTVLRRNSNGAIRDLVNQNISISHFYVAPNSEVILCGRTNSSGRGWLRKLSPQNRLTTLVVSPGCNYMERFQDGNLWIGGFRTMRYSLKDGKLLRDPYGWATESNKPVVNFASPKYWDSFIEERHGDFFSNHGYIDQAFNIRATRSTWVIRERSLIQVVPNLAFADTSILSYTLSERVLDNLILTGTDAKDVNRLIIYNTTNGSEIVVFDGRNEIEIYDMVFIAGTNTLMFSGLRFSDNRFVIGEVRL